jgi:hypothetical protein
MSRDPRSIEIDLEDVCGIGHCEQGDACQQAVQRAYGEMRSRGQPDRYAFDAALRIYQWHHPGVPCSLAREVVSRWVWDGVRH